MLAGGVLGLSLALTAADTPVAVCWALAVALGSAGLANRYVRPVAKNRALVDASGVACLVGAMCATLNATNQTLDPPLLSDAAGLIAGTVVTTVSGLVWILITRTSDGDAGDE